MTSSDTALQQLAQRGYVSLNQFCKLPGINVSYPTALRMKKNGQIKGVQVGGIFKIYAKEVKRFLKQGNATEEEELHGSSYLPDSELNTFNDEE